MQAILVAPDPEDRDFLGYVLRQVGLTVGRAADLGQVKVMAEEQPVDFVLAAVADSVTLVREIRDVRMDTQAPLVLLLETVTEARHCELLDAGVDLVLRRPYSPRLLSRYARMLLNRARAVPATVLPTIKADGISLDPATRAVTVNGRETESLTPLEFRLLYVLMANEGQVLPVETIVERVWGYSGEGNRELVRGLVRRLRRKIEPDPNQPRFIHNLPGVGYRFVERKSA